MDAGVAYCAVRRTNLWDHAARFTEAVFRNKAQRLSKTRRSGFKPKKHGRIPLTVLDRAFGSGNLARRDIVRLADALNSLAIRAPQAGAGSARGPLRNVGEFPTETIPGLQPRHSKGLAEYAGPTFRMTFRGKSLQRRWRGWRTSRDGNTRSNSPTTEAAGRSLPVAVSKSLSSDCAP